MDDVTTADPHQVKRLTALKFLKELEGRPFHLSLVSPLLGLTFNEMYLARTASKLSSQLRKKVSRRKVSVEFMVKPSKCIKISVFVNKSIEFEAYLFRVSAVETKGLCFLPFLCTTVQGNVDIVTKFKLIFQQKFSCTISNLKSPEYSFHWLIGLAVHETLRREINDGMTIAYGVPGMSSGHIHLTLEDKSLFTLWTTCYGYKPDLNNISQKCISMFMDCLNAHFLSDYGLDVSDFTLRRITLEGAHIALNGDKLTVRINDWGIMVIILKFIEALCIKDDPILSPPGKVKYSV